MQTKNKNKKIFAQSLFLLNYYMEQSKELNSLKNKLSKEQSLFLPMPIIHEIIIK